MNSLRKSVYLVAVAVSLCTVAPAETPVRLILSPQVVVADRGASGFLPDRSLLAARFGEKCRAAFPGQVLNLDDPRQRVTPDDRVIILVPTIQLARMSDELKAGSVHDFEAFLVGDISAIDPWTEADLFSATRMSYREFKIGQTEIGALGSTAHSAFRDAVDGWMDAAIDQLKTQLSPFVLEAGTVAIPGSAAAFTGGIWPFGSDRGVKTGQVLRGGQGRLAKITAVFPKYSLIADVADSSRRLDGGERYSLLQVVKPAARPEPLVRLSWVGAPLDVRTSARSLSDQAITGLFSSYLSQRGGLRILPYQVDDQTDAQVTAIVRDYDSHFGQAQGNLTVFNRQNIANRAAENPDRWIEIGIVNLYHGTKMLPDGTRQHLFRATLAASVRQRSGTDESPRYPVASTILQDEEIAKIEETGVRDIDEANVTFTLLRNGTIHLAEKVRDQAATALAFRAPQFAVVQNGTVDWEGAQPGTFTPVTWLRPQGEISDGHGNDLGRLYRLMVPSRGFLNVAGLTTEKLTSGDVLEYRSAHTEFRPAMGLSLAVAGEVPAWLPDPAWLLRAAASDLASSAGAEIIPIESGEPESGAPVSEISISALAESNEPSQATFTGQFRCRISKRQADPASTRLLSFGIQFDTPVVLKRDGAHLEPLDISGWGGTFSISALHALSEAGMHKGIKQVVSTANQ